MVCCSLMWALGMTYCRLLLLPRGQILGRCPRLGGGLPRLVGTRSRSVGGLVGVVHCYHCFVRLSIDFACTAARKGLVSV